MISTVRKARQPGIGLLTMLVVASLGAGDALAATWQRNSANPLFASGLKLSPGGQAVIAMGDADVLYDGSDSKWKMWFGAGYLLGKGVRVSDMYAESPDGVNNWQVQSSLALKTAASSKAWDYTNAETPAVVRNPNRAAPPSRRFMMWYSGANDERKKLLGFSYYQIGLAFSADGKRFKRLPAAESPFGKAGLTFMARDAFPGKPKIRDGVVADPEVIVRNRKFHMWFSAIGVDKRHRPLDAGIGYATSKDGIHWRASRKNTVLGPVPLSRDYPAPGQPSVLWNPAKGGWDIWFTNDTKAEKQTLPEADVGTIGYWHAFSRNGVDWSDPYSSGRDFKVDTSLPIESFGLHNGTEVVLRDGDYWMYYAGNGSAGIPAELGSHAFAFDLATRPAD